MRRRQLGAQSETLAIQTGILCAAPLAAVSRGGKWQDAKMPVQPVLQAAVPGDGPRRVRPAVRPAERLGRWRQGPGTRGGHCCAGWCW